MRTLAQRGDLRVDDFSLLARRLSSSPTESGLTQIAHLSTTASSSVGTSHPTCRGSA